MRDRRSRASRSAPAAPGTRPAREPARASAGAARRPGRARAARASIAAMSAGSPDSAAQRNGPDAAAEERPDIGRDKARVCEGVLYACLAGLPSQVVAIIENIAALRGRTRAALDVAPRSTHARDAGTRPGRDARSAAASSTSSPCRHVAGQRVVGRRLVGDEVEVLAAPRELRHDLGGVAEQPDRKRPPLAQPPPAPRRARRRATRSPRRGSASRAGARSATGRPRRRGSPRRPSSPRAAARRPSRRARP